jgi:hypothetical protein
MLLKSFRKIRKFIKFKYEIMHGYKSMHSRMTQEEWILNNKPLPAPQCVRYNHMINFSKKEIQ